MVHNKLLDRLLYLLLSTHFYEEPNNLKYADLVLGLEKHVCIRSGVQIHLTPKEFALLKYNIFLSFADTTESDDDVTIVANLYLLALAFRNLIENNCKYSPDHTSIVTIHVQRGLSIVFADNGIGMTNAEIQNLFNMFYRGNSHSVSGHGIGMALIKRITALHNANINVQSKEGHGTKFTLSFAR